LPSLEELLQFDLVAFVQIVLIDLTLSGDNAIIIGLAAAGLPPDQRRRAIAIGIVAATLLRIGNLCAPGDRRADPCRRHSAAVGDPQDVARDTRGGDVAARDERGRAMRRRQPRH
jgi:hypothetical protein